MAIIRDPDQLTFDQLRSGDEIDNVEEDEFYVVLYDRHNSTVTPDAVIIETYLHGEKGITKTLTRKEFNNKHLIAYRG